MGFRALGFRDFSTWGLSSRKPKAPSYSYGLGLADPFKMHLTGQGDLVSGLLLGIARVTTWVSGDDPPSGRPWSSVQSCV